MPVQMARAGVLNQNRSGTTPEGVGKAMNQPCLCWPARLQRSWA